MKSSESVSDAQCLELLREAHRDDAGTRTRWVD